MPADDDLLNEVADAILDGTPIDWSRVESHADGPRRVLLDRLKVLAALTDFQRHPPSISPPGPERHEDPPEAEVEHNSPGLGRWGHLEIIELIGRGACGQVYRARDTRLDRDVALKLLPANRASGDAAVSSIIEEGRLLAQIRHANVVTIYGAERIGDQIGLWMELVNGHTLAEILEEGKRFTETEIVELGVQLCGAISAVHDAGLLHRDIKAQNVMLADAGRLVLMDFGTGRDLGDNSAVSLAGTPLYLAPELLSGDAPSVRSDIYSLGVLLYHLLTASFPVRASTLRDLCTAHEERARTTVTHVLPGVTAKLARIIERAIAPTAARRYQNIDALRSDLVALRSQSKVVRVPNALRLGAATFLIVAIGWEVGGRQLESSVTPSALLGRALGLSAPGGANVPATGPLVIAVLPFTNLSAEPDSDYLVDGLADDIIQKLVGVHGLEVRSRASSFAFKDKPRNLREVGDRLGASLIIEGSVMRSGGRLRIDARLVQVAGDVLLWHAQFDRGLHDLFAINDEISHGIVNKLRLTAGRGQRRYDSNIDTYILYLKARERLGRRGGPDAQAASELFQQVIKDDPAFAPAYAGLAEAYGLMSHPTLAQGIAEAALPLMQDAANKALALDELLAEGHAALGFIYARQYDWERAENSFRRAIDLNPSLTQTYINYWTTTLLPRERLDEAERLLQVAMRTDPLSATVHGELGFLTLIAARFDESIDHFQRARALDPDLPYLDQHLGRALTFAGRLSEALSWWDSRTDPSGKVRFIDAPGGQPWVAAAYVMAGRRAEVERWGEAQNEPYRLALIHAALGHKDRTFEELERAAEIVPHRVVPLLSYPEMRLLRGDPRLSTLRKKLHLQK